MIIIIVMMIVIVKSWRTLQESDARAATACLRAGPEGGCEIRAHRRHSRGLSPPASLLCLWPLLLFPPRVVVPTWTDSRQEGLRGPKGLFGPLRAS